MEDAAPEASAAAAGGSSSLVFRGCHHLPPGFRFQPTDQEIIVCYLRNKIAAAAAAVTSIIADVDIYKFDPWDLPGQCVWCSRLSLRPSIIYSISCTLHIYALMHRPINLARRSIDLDRSMAINIIIHSS
jgi:hypothetical protein